MKIRMIRSLAAIVTLGVCGAASAAITITDPVGDFLPTFGGNPATSGDLDVIGAGAVYDATTQLFSLSALLNGTPGTTANNLYVWGLNSGTGVVNAGFASSGGIDGVRFNRVITFGAGATTIAGLTGSVVSVTGNTIEAVFSLASLGTPPAGSFANPLDYTWNLWPRNTTFPGFAAISDFAPNNANFATVAGTVRAVPEPATIALLTLGLAGLAFARRRGVTAAASASVRGALVG